MREITVLHVEDCPHVPVVLERLAAVTCGDASIQTVQVDPDVLPAEFAGSPTVLVDGRNLAGAARTASASCIVTVPTIEELKRALDT